MASRRKQERIILGKRVFVIEIREGTRLIDLAEALPVGETHRHLGGLSTPEKLPFAVPAGVFRLRYLFVPSYPYLSDTLAFCEEKGIKLPGLAQLLSFGVKYPNEYGPKKAECRILSLGDRWESKNGSNFGCPLTHSLKWSRFFRQRLIETVSGSQTRDLLADGDRIIVDAE